MSVFDYVNAITVSKVDLMATAESPELAEKEYVPFVVNRALSYFSDTVAIANEMNRRPHLDNRCQFSFLLHIVPKRRRIAKWHKKTTSDATATVSQYYNCSLAEAEQYASLLTSDQIDVLKERMFTGGVVRNGATKS